MASMVHSRENAHTFTYNASISACDKEVEWARALELMARMVHSRVQALSMTYNAAISACDKEVQWARALELMARMVHSRVQALSMTYNAAISACEKSRVGQGSGAHGQHGAQQGRGTYNHVQSRDQRLREKESGHELWSSWPGGCRAAESRTQSGTIFFMDWWEGLLGGGHHHHHHQHHHHHD